MKIYIKTVKLQKGGIELTLEEAKWLKALVQNPLPNCAECPKQQETFENESDIDNELRQEFFENLKKIIKKMEQ